jgi:histone deacetylase complex subunit SAP30
MGWDDIPLSVLHNYRHAYRLPVPSASSSYRGIVLSSGIGKKTPSACGRGHRSSRDALATAVRKNFNAQPIQENEVIVNFLYTVKNQGEKSEKKLEARGEGVRSGGGGGGKADGDLSR